MKKVSYLTALVVILALFVLGCGQGAPNASSRNEVVPQKDVPTVSSENEVGTQLTPELVGNPNGNCCPVGFTLVFVELEQPADRNGDNLICVNITRGFDFAMDNNVACLDLPCPPDCGGGF